MGLRLVFVLAQRVLSWARLSRREESWKSAEIVLLRHQLTVPQRQVSTRPRLTWADRALIALLLSATLENEAIATVENEATQTDWMGDFSGGLGCDPAPGC